VAIVFSYFSHRKTPAGRTVDKISSLASRSADLLGKMAEGVAAGYEQDQAGEWLAKARLLADEIPALRTQALEALGYAKWFSTAQKVEAENLYTQGIAIEHTVVQVRTIARTLFEAAVEDGIPISTQRQIAHALSSASYAITTKADQIRNLASLATTESATSDIRLAGAALADSLIDNSTQIGQEHLVRGIALVSNIERIADSLDESSPALHEVLTPGEPASNKILKVSTIDQTTKLSKRLLKPFKRLFRK
ncbi:MAG: hypothetical protein WCQ78_04295, partial [Actinomycetes bacterium]